jgi:hypothetical protein
MSDTRGSAVLPGTESLIPDPANQHYLMITVKRRDYLRAKTALDNAVWKAHKAGVPNTVIASAYECTEASVRDRLKRIKAEKARAIADAS